MEMKNLETVRYLGQDISPVVVLVEEVMVSRA